MFGWLGSKKTSPADALKARVRAGYEAQSAGRFDEAREHYEAVLLADPQQADACYLMGLLTMHSDGPESALPFLERAIRSDPHNPPFHYSHGETLRVAGRLEAAAAAFERAVEADPSEAEWWNELGRTLEALGRSEAARDAYAKAVELRPDHAVAWCNLGGVETDREASQQALLRATDLAPDLIPAWVGLGGALRSLGDDDGAMAAYLRALSLDPDQPEALVNLADLHVTRKDPTAAENALRRALARRPDFVEAWINLGILMRTQGRLDAAIHAHGRAVEYGRGQARTHLQLGTTLEAAEQLEAAEIALHEGLTFDQRNADLHHALANVLRTRCAFEESEIEYRKAIDLDPGSASLWINYANLLFLTGRGTACAGALEQAVEADPDLPVAHLNLGIARMNLGRIPEAESSLRRALELDPLLCDARLSLAALYFLVHRLHESESECREILRIDDQHAGAYLNLGTALQQQGRLEESLASTRRSIALQPDSGQAYSNQLMTLNYRAETTPEELLAAHRAFGARFAPKRSIPRDTSAGRRLRIGYLSPDFRHHVVASFFEPVLVHHDRREFEAICYFCGGKTDDITARLESHADLWRDISALDDDLAERIVLQDRLDVLVDLAGHTSKNRLPLVAHRLAPIQVTWLGYPSTTGLPAMDWRITDSIADPAGTADDHHTERLWRIDPLFLTWRPPGSAPDVTLPPSAVRSGFTFGSYNNFAKVTDRTMALWGRVLQAVPESRLVLKTMSLSDAEVQIRARSRLIQQGCDPDRIEIRGPVAGGSGHLASYGDIDVALDTHPYNGTTTTCESLWMGVPVITLRGDRHASRVGASLLSAIGLDDLVADNPDDYVRLAAMLARDAPRLAALRRGLRDRVKQSALVDAVGFTRALENAYRSMGRAHTDRSTVAVAR